MKIENDKRAIIHLLPLVLPFLLAEKVKARKPLILLGLQAFRKQLVGESNPKSHTAIADKMDVFAVLYKLPVLHIRKH